MQPLLFRIICSYIDQGIAISPFPFEDKGLLNAVRNLDLSYLVCFALGAGCGFLVFSRVIEWLLRHYHHQTLMLLVGLLLGSLQATWPWKLALEQSPISQNISPARYAEIFGSAQLGLVILAVGIAMVLVWTIERLGRSRKGVDAAL